MWWHKAKSMNAKEDHNIMPADGMRARHGYYHLKDEFIDPDETIHDEYTRTSFKEELWDTDVGSTTRWSSVGDDVDIQSLGHVDLKALSELTSPLESYQHITIVTIIIWLLIKSILHRQDAREGLREPSMPIAMQDGYLFDNEICISPQPLQLKPVGYVQKSPVEQPQYTF
jgi:hypothetical protein